MALQFTYELKGKEYTHEELKQMTFKNETISRVIEDVNKRIKKNWEISTNDSD